MKGRVLAALGVALVMAAAGCGRGQQIENPGDTDSPLRRQAAEALARWDEAVRKAGGQQGFAPVGETYTQIGDWEPANGDFKASLGSGRVVVDDLLEVTRPVTADVRWADGTVRRLKTMDAIEAARLLIRPDAAQACANCPDLRVTGAKPTSMTIQTTRGEATVPAWEYTFAGTNVKVRQSAVARSAGVSVTPPSWDPYNPPGGIWIESARVHPDGRSLTATFTGAPKPASEPCGADYTGEAVESEHAVVVIVWTHPHGVNETCNSIGAARTAEVELARPLGERAILEVVQGLPVKVTS